MPPGDGPVDPPWKSDVDFLPASEETFVDADWTLDADALLDTATMVAAGLPDGVTFRVGMQEVGGEVAILRVRTLKLNNNRTLSVQGTRPLVVLADEIVLDGVLDAGGHGATAGPAGFSAATGPGAGKPSVHVVGGYDDPGAGGGSFGTAGAAGGKIGAADGGTAGDVYELTNQLLGGSSGGAAGVCINRPGGGGGALLLYAKKRIRLVGSGAINVGGGGGEGGVESGCTSGAGAGAGGGSGGTLWLQTPSLEGDGTLAANGGGGGGGSYVNIGNGGNGGDGKASTTTAAAGGIKANSDEATAGGNGAVAGIAATAVPAITAGNAGGGGGGLGRIVARVKTAEASLKASPAITKAP